MTAIVLIGFMGAGKTTISKRLAQRLHRPLIDMDDQLVELLDCPIHEYFATHGEAAFRQQETAVLARALEEGAIVATGGGVVLQAENQALLKDHLVIYLQADPELLIQRIRRDQHQIRPLAVNKNDEELKELFFSRKNQYEALADITVNTNERSKEAVVLEIIQEVERL